MVNNPITKASFNPIYLAINNYIGKLANLRSVYNFDGVDDRGQLQFRAINPDGDIDIEWRSGPTISFATSRTIVSQTQTTVGTNQEFFMFIATNGNLAVRVGGLERGTNPAIVYQPNTKYRWRLQGTVVNFWINDVLQPAMSLTRGTAREPNASTQIGSAAGTFLYLGELYDVRINGVLYPMIDQNQIVQLPYPNRLGQELITQSVLENPSARGTQWTYLGNGRWQYIGDGLGDLVFISTANLPESALIEFEVESYQLVSGTGGMRVSPTTTNFFGDRLFTGTGKFKCFYTSKPASVSFTRNNPGTLINCVIKNISFKPLWVSSATELVTNGNFSNGTANWYVTGSGSIAVTGEQCTLTTASQTNSRFEQGLTLEANAYYVAEADIVSISGVTQARLWILRGELGNYKVISVASATSNNTKLRFVFMAPASDALVQINGDSTNAGSITVDNISVRKIISLCNPLTLVNTASTGWQEIEA